MATLIVIQTNAKRTIIALYVLFVVRKVFAHSEFAVFILFVSQLLSISLLTKSISWLCFIVAPKGEFGLRSKLFEMIEYCVQWSIWKTQKWMRMGKMIITDLLRAFRIIFIFPRFVLYCFRHFRLLLFFSSFYSHFIDFSAHLTAPYNSAIRQSQSIFAICAIWFYIV